MPRARWAQAEIEGINVCALFFIAEVVGLGALDEDALRDGNAAQIKTVEVSRG